MANKKIKSSEGNADARFKIGAVSRITQIPVDTLRAWERRYQVVSPQRTGSAARLYGNEDVERLKLIKRLVGNGHAISSVAGLSLTELAERVQLHDSTSPDHASTDGRAIATASLFSASRATLLPPEDALREDIEILSHCRSWAEFEKSVLETSPDALVIDIPALLHSQAQQISRLRIQSAAARVIVIYGFAPHRVLADLAREGVVALKSPFDDTQLGRELLRPLASNGQSVVEFSRDVVPRILDNATLESLAQISPAVQCECPHHLVEIVRTLTQFELYSAECENNNDEDAALHAKLRATTSTARELFELALIDVAEYEGIVLPDSIKI